MSKIHFCIGSRKRRFGVLHREKVPSAIDRYVRQCERILGVLKGALERKTWLVSNKCSYADLSVFIWKIVLPLSMLYPAGQTPLSKYPNVLAR
jgi:glutathione S-transferase